MFIRMLLKLFTNIKQGSIEAFYTYCQAIDTVKSENENWTSFCVKLKFHGRLMRIRVSISKKKLLSAVPIW